MLLTEKRGEGHQGISVILSAIDQYEITHLVDRLKAYFTQKDALDQWEEKYAALPWKERDKFQDENPKPVKPQEPTEELRKAFVFLKKLALDKIIMSNVFDEE